MLINDIGNIVVNIKNFIRTWRAKHIGLGYVLLFGDVDMIASETVTSSPFGNNMTDYYYCTQKDHFEIYQVVGDPTLELWRAAPMRISLKSYVQGRYLYVSLNRVPKDTVISIYNNNELLRRLHPASNFIRLALPWEYVAPPELPHTARFPLRVCFYAPGYRFRQIRPEIWRPVIPTGVDLPEMVTWQKVEEMEKESV